MVRGFISLCLRPRKANIGACLSRALSRLSDVEIKACPKTFLERCIHTSPIPSRLYQDIKCDKYSHMLLDEYYDQVGPVNVVFSMRWPLSLAWADTKQLEEHFYVHGPWFSGPIVIDVQKMTHEDYAATYMAMLGEFESVFAMYEREIMWFWADFHQPNSPVHAKYFILEQWEKHGLPYGVKADVYLYYGLGFAASFPPNFGIPVGQNMSYHKLESCVAQTLHGLELFGDPIGHSVYPYIIPIYDPRVDSATSEMLPLVVHEIRTRFQRVAIDKAMGWKLVPRSSLGIVRSRGARWTLVGVDKLRMYGGDRSILNQHQGIILP